MELSEIEKKVYEHDKDIAVMAKGYVDIKTDLTEIKEAVKEIKGVCSKRSCGGGFGDFFQTKIGQTVIYFVVIALLSLFGFNSQQLGELKKEFKETTQEVIRR